jgi:ABC-type phosphonate transport system ATPase subunit
MRQRIFSSPNQHPGRVLVMLGEEVIAQGSLSNLAVISRALSTPGANVYLHPADAADFQIWQVEEAARKRRLN